MTAPAESAGAGGPCVGSTPGRGDVSHSRRCRDRGHAFVHCVHEAAPERCPDAGDFSACACPRIRRAAGARPAWPYGCCSLQGADGRRRRPDLDGRRLPRGAGGRAGSPPSRRPRRSSRASRTPRWCSTPSPATDPTAVLQPYVEEIRADTGTSFITVLAPDRTRYTHPDPSEIGRPFRGTIAPALAGETFTETYTGTLGPSVRATGPVLDAGRRGRGAGVRGRHGRRHRRGPGGGGARHRRHGRWPPWPWADWAAGR